MRNPGERLLLGLLLAAVPALVVGLVILPSTRRLEALRQRLEAAHQVAADAGPFVPVSGEERAFLEAPDAPWRSRIPWVPDDGARLVQVDRVVNELAAALSARGVRVGGMKAQLDPVQADFSQPERATREAFPRRAAADAPEHRMYGWVLEVEILGPTRELFKALAAVAAVNALLEPAGLRWSAAQAQAGEAPRKRQARGPNQAHRQVLLLRNYYLKPGG